MSSRSAAQERSQSSKAQSSKENPEAPTTHDEGLVSTSDSGGSQSENEYRPKRQREEAMRLTEEEYIMVAKDIMSKPPFSGYLKYHLPLRYAARCEEVRWQWQDQGSKKMVYKDLIGGGRNSDLEYD